MNQHATLVVTSTTFTDGQTLPKSMLFDGMEVGGDNRSPQLSWTGAPANTQSFAITLFDPDAPTTVGFWHWLIADIPPETTELAENAGHKHHAPKGSTMGHNDFGLNEYSGMGPPPGDPPHRYIITVYALDTKKLGIENASTGALTMFMLRDHILAKGTIGGTFGR